MKQPAPVFDPANRSHEHCSYIIESLVTGRRYRGHFNLPNEGCISNLSDDAIVEVPVYVDGNGLSVPKVGPLPLGCAAICNASISVQRLAVEAAVHGDVMLLKQAMLMDPLTAAVCTPPEISQMTDEMLIAQSQWLPQYAAAIPEVEARFAAEPRLGRKSIKGAARLKTKTVAEMQKNAEAARRNAGAADKAMEQRKKEAAVAVGRRTRRAKKS